jgi:hypothetical protein
MQHGRNADLLALSAAQAQFRGEANSEITNVGGVVLTMRIVGMERPYQTGNGPPWSFIDGIPWWAAVSVMDHGATGSKDGQYSQARCPTTSRGSSELVFWEGYSDIAMSQSLNWAN